MLDIEAILKSDAEIRIVSGEGLQGYIEDYEDTRTLRALKIKLKEEKCGGDRWARAEYDVTGHGDWDILIDAKGRIGGSY